MRSLAELREAAGKTQQTVADELGIALRTLIRHEQGETPLNGMHRIAYGHYYGVDPSTIDTDGKETAA